jgi:hypothetical protein
MRPSRDAGYLNEAIELLRQARGTNREEAARAYLELVVSELKGQRK